LHGRPQRFAHSHAGHSRRNGHFAAADEALLCASKVGKDVNVAGIAALYRAMSLFQLGKKDEATDVAAKGASQMKPLPTGERDFKASDAVFAQLSQWLAYKEAKAMIGFDAPPASPAMPGGN
jgi:hypothetical protein